MQTAIIYAFSGTFHTLKAARMIGDALQKRGVHTRVCEVKLPLDALPSPAGYDIVGFGYPVHAFNAPEVFIRFVRQLPASSQHAFIFKTSGEPFPLNNASSGMLYRLLRRKGYDVTLDMHMLMPYNIMFRYKDALAKQMVLYTEAQSRMLALRIVSEERDDIRFSIRHSLVSFLLRIEWLAPKVNSPLCSANMKKCTLCGRCAQMCPTKNIRIENDKVMFDGHCALCMRCTMFCPQDAIRFGILNPWKVNGGYNFKRLLADPAIPWDFVREDTTGYFRLFRKYYRNADAVLARYGIRLAVPEAQEASVEMADDPEVDAIGMG